MIPITEDLLQRVFKEFPSLEEVYETNFESFDEELGYRLEESFIALAASKGMDLNMLESEKFQAHGFSSFSAIGDVVTDEDWTHFASLGEKGWAAVLAFYDWSIEQVWEVYSRDYQVERLSKHTEPRWRAFVKKWASMTVEQRQTVWDEYKNLLAEDPSLDPSWQLMFASGAWKPLDEEVPFVAAEVRDRSKAVPTGANGKQVSVPGMAVEPESSVIPESVV